MVIGASGRSSGTPGGVSKMKLSELLVFGMESLQQMYKRSKATLLISGVTNKLSSGHPYTASAPTFADPIGAVDMTLFWGTNDGGTNPTLWEHEVNLGRYFKEQVDINGFNAYGYQSTSRNESYLKDVETLRAVTADQTLDFQGNPLRGNEQHFRNAELIPVGLINDTDGDGVIENYMTLSSPASRHPPTGPMFSSSTKGTTVMPSGWTRTKTEYSKVEPLPQVRVEMKCSRVIRMSITAVTWMPLPLPQVRNISLPTPILIMAAMADPAKTDITGWK